MNEQFIFACTANGEIITHRYPTQQERDAAAEQHTQQCDCTIGRWSQRTYHLDH